MIWTQLETIWLDIFSTTKSFVALHITHILPPTGSLEQKLGNYKKVINLFGTSSFCQGSKIARRGISYFGIKFLNLFRDVHIPSTFHTSNLDILKIIFGNTSNDPLCLLISFTLKLQLTWFSSMAVQLIALVFVHIKFLVSILHHQPNMF